MSIGTDTYRSQVRISKPESLEQLHTALADYLEREQNGGINQLGLRLQLRAVVPVDAPAANQPNYVLIENGGGLGPQPYVYVPGTGWMPIAQTALPAAHVLATTAGLGTQHTVTGLTLGMVLVATGATGASFAFLDFAHITGNLTYGQLPNTGGTWAAGGAVSITGGVLTVAGLTSTALVLTAASGTGSSGFRLPHGAAPTSPVNGDTWTTTAGLFSRINGATVGPYTTGGGSLTGSGTTGTIPIFTAATAVGDSELSIDGNGLLITHVSVNCRIRVKSFDANAAGENVGIFSYMGRDASGGDQEYGSMIVKIQTATAGVADGEMLFSVYRAGANTTALSVNDKVRVAGGFDFVLGQVDPLLRTSVTLTGHGGVAAGTLTNAPAAGNPTKWIAIDDNGTTRYFPAW